MAHEPVWFAVRASVMVLAVIAGGGSAAAQAVDVPRVPCQPCTYLMLDADDTNRPGFQALLAGLREATAGRPGQRDNLYIENLDLARFPGPEHEAAVIDWVASKYRDRHIDAIVSVGTLLMPFTTRLRDRLWPSAVLVSFGDASPGERGPPGVGMLITDLDVTATIRTARRLFPGTTDIQIIGGPSYGDVVGASIFGKARQVAGVQARFVPAMTLDELHRYVAAATPETVFLFVTVYRDRAGAATVPRDALASLSRATARPIFAFSETYLGHGTIGGDLLDLREVGRRLGRLAEATIAAGRHAPGPVATLAGTLALDYRELQRWGVRDRQIPDDARVLFRPPGLWDQYRDAVAAALVALAVQAAWISWLLVERRQRRRAQQQLHQLSGRMIETQEGERSRIARDLHDDVNQRVALAAIELDRIAHDVSPPAAMAPQVIVVADELRALGLDVHALAHQLRPADLEYVGLPVALRSLAGNVSQRTGLAIEVVDTGWPLDAPPAAAIVCYRVAQEALQNVRKHSAATICRVTVGMRRSALTLRVSDDGVGFDTAQRMSASHLGLAGMTERLRLVGGRLLVRSTRGHGTDIDAEVPLPLHSETLAVDAR